MTDGRTSEHRATDSVAAVKMSLLNKLEEVVHVNSSKQFLHRGSNEISEYC